ncbi:MAG: hypothetical protein ACI4WQ_05250 [Sharpea porci]
MKNNRGSTITAVIVITLVVMILSGTMLSMAYSYYMHSYREIYTRQASLCASSACEIIGKTIHNADSQTDYQQFIPKDHTKTLSNFTLTKDGKNADIYKDVQMNGTVEIVDAKTLKITINVTYKTGQATSTLTMLKDKETDSQWQIGKLK